MRHIIYYCIHTYTIADTMAPEQRSSMVVVAHKRPATLSIVIRCRQHVFGYLGQWANRIMGQSMSESP